MKYPDNVVMDAPRYCPVCRVDFKGTEIKPESRENFGNCTHFSRIIGIEITEQYDGVSQWKCPDCSYTWNRDFTYE